MTDSVDEDTYDQWIRQVSNPNTQPVIRPPGGVDWAEFLYRARRYQAMMRPARKVRYARGLDRDESDLA
jgi:hypothetical protein